MRLVALLPLAACTASPRPANVAALAGATLEVRLADGELTAYFRFPDAMGCPALDPKMRATVNGEPVALASPQPDPDAYPRGTPCEGYQLTAIGTGAADIRVWDRSGEARVVIPDAFVARTVSGEPALAPGDVGHFAWSPASDTVIGGELRFTGTRDFTVTALDVDGADVRYRIPDDEAGATALTASLTASVAIDTCRGFASCAGVASLRL